ncbi:MAG: cyclic nucleotide-binding domain-containing protein [bacterium]
MSTRMENNSISFKNEAIFHEGEPGNETMYLIKKGTVEISKDGILIARIGPGEPVGEMSLLLEESRTATVRAIGDVEALEITGKNFAEILSKEPGIGWIIMKALAKRLKDTTTALVKAQ